MGRKIFLSGFMGCGKTSLGRRLARETGWDFVDTDREIERRAGMTVAEIFARQGEEVFRALEASVIADAAALEKDTVVALGGGAVCRPGAMEMLSEVGETVYLKCSPARLCARIGKKGRAARPKIAGMNDDELAAYIEKTLPEREKYYNMATFVLDCDTMSDTDAVKFLLQQTRLKTR